MRGYICWLLFCLVLAAFSGQAHPVDPDLVLYLPMDDGAGDELTDASENGHNGTIVGDAEWIDGRHGRAVQLNTTEAEIQVPDDAALDGLEAITIELWVRQDSHQATGVVQKGDNWPNISYLLQPWSDQQIYFGVQDTSSRAITKPGDYPLSEWYHLAGAFDGENLTIYINGEEKASAPAPVDTVPDTTQPLQVGNRLVGAIDEFVMYSRALTEDEVRSDMNGVTLPVENRGKTTLTWGDVKTGVGNKW